MADVHIDWLRSEDIFLPLHNEGSVKQNIIYQSSMVDIRGTTQISTTMVARSTSKGKSCDACHRLDLLWTMWNDLLGWLKNCS
jgi:hypothetical protein